MGLSRAERSFVQCMMGAGALPARRTAALFNACVENAGLPDSSRVLADDADDEEGIKLADALTRINKHLSTFELAFSAGFHAKETHWGLTNVGRDASVKQATNFSPAELALFFAIRDRIVAEADGRISLVEAHNEGPCVKLKVADAARAVGKLVGLQWLRVTRQNGRQVEFGARAMLELPDVRDWARRRTADGNGVKEEGSEDVAPSQDPSVSQGAAVDQEDVKPANHGRARRKSQPARNGADDDEDGVDEGGTNEQEEDEVRPRRGRSQRKSQARPSRTQEANSDADEDEDEDEDDPPPRRKRARNGTQSRRSTEAVASPPASRRRSRRDEDEVAPRRSGRTQASQVDSPLTAPRPRGR